MITKVEIKDNKKTPLNYLDKVFKNDTVFEFKKGANIVVGENGTGKSTLMKLIKKYMLIDVSLQSVRNNVCKLINNENSGINDGVDVYGDYELTVFNMLHQSDFVDDNQKMQNNITFSSTYSQSHSSTGEGCLISIQSLFKHMFSDKAVLKFPEFDKKDKWDGDYAKYVESHKVQCFESFRPIYTVLMDEPDRNLSLQNINSLFGVLAHPREDTQLICVIHNPLLLYRLYKKCKSKINFIELTNGYMDNIVSEIDKIVKG